MRKRDPRALLGLRLRSAARWFEDGLMAAMAESSWASLTLPQTLLLLHIDERGTHIAELARRCHVTRQAAHQTVGELIEAGKVELRPHPTHGSAKLVLRTAGGIDAANAARATLQEFEEQLGDRIGDRDLGDLIRALETDWGPPPPPILEDDGPHARAQSSGRGGHGRRAPLDDLDDGDEDAY